MHTITKRILCLTQALMILVVYTCPREAAAAQDLSRPSPSALRGDLIPPSSEPGAERMERQAAENLLLQGFGLRKAGFAPNAARHRASMFPLVYDAVRASLGDDATPARIEARLEGLLTNPELRQIVTPYVLAAGLEALKVPPAALPSYPAAEAFQRQFAPYYTNQVRAAADRTYAAWELHKCRNQAVHPSLSTVLTGSHVSRKTFDALTDPFGFGVEGLARIEPYARGLFATVAEDHDELVDAALVEHLSASLSIAAGAAAEAVGVLLLVKFAPNIVLGSTGWALSASAIASMVTYSVGAALVVIPMWIGAGLHTADLANTGRWERGLLAQREDTSTEDPYVLHARYQEAREREDVVFQSELLLILMKMILVDSAWLDYIYDAPQPPTPIAADNEECPYGRYFNNIDGIVRCLDEPLTFARPTSVGLGVDEEMITPRCEKPPGPTAPWAPAPDFRTPYFGRRSILQRSLLKDAILRPGWNALGVQAFDVGAAADGALWFLGPDPISMSGHAIYRKAEGGGFEQMPGAAKRIAVGSHEHVAVVNAGGDVFRWTGSSWEKLPGHARDVGIAEDGSLWIVGGTPTVGGDPIYRWDGQGWTNVPGGAVRVDVGPNDVAIVMNDVGQVFRRHRDAWQDLGSTAIDVGAGAGRSLWRLNAELSGPGGAMPQPLYHWDWFFGDLVAPAWGDPIGGLGENLSVRDNERVVVTNAARELWEHVPPRF